MLMARKAFFPSHETGCECFQKLSKKKTSHADLILKIPVSSQTTIGAHSASKVLLPNVAAYGGMRMLWTIFVILLILWLLGIVSSYTLGGFIHLLLVLALVVLLIQLVTGRRTAL